jgi:hypothetical protein
MTMGASRELAPILACVMPLAKSNIELRAMPQTMVSATGRAYPWHHARNLPTQP